MKKKYIIVILVLLTPFIIFQFNKIRTEICIMQILKEANFYNNIETSEMHYDLKRGHYISVTYKDSPNIYKYTTIVSKKSINTDVYDKDMDFLTYHQENDKYYIRIRP